MGEGADDVVLAYGAGAAAGGEPWCAKEECQYCDVVLRVLGLDDGELTCTLRGIRGRRVSSSHD